VKNKETQNKVLYNFSYSLFLLLVMVGTRGRAGTGTVEIACEVATGSAGGGVGFGSIGRPKLSITGSLRDLQYSSDFKFIRLVRVSLFTPFAARFLIILDRFTQNDLPIIQLRRCTRNLWKTDTNVVFFSQNYLLYTACVKKKYIRRTSCSK